jgi:hypothetical protein
MRELTTGEIALVSGADKAGEAVGTIVGGIAGEIYGGSFGATVGALGGFLGPEVGIPTTAVGAVLGERWGGLVGATVGGLIGDAVGDFLHDLNSFNGTTGSTFTPQMESTLMGAITSATNYWGPGGLAAYNDGGMNTVISDLDATDGAGWQGGYSSGWGGTASGSGTSTSGGCV